MLFAVFILNVHVHRFDHHVCHVGVHIPRSLGGPEIDLVSSLGISS